MTKEIDVLKICTTDEYANSGGRYIIDPNTGTRVPADEEKKTVIDQPLIDNEEEEKWQN